MDEISTKILNSVGIYFNGLNELNGQFIPRENFLSDLKYEEVKKFIPDLKKNYSSSMMTSLQKNANIYQRWPLLNLIRQILNSVGYKMDPIRKSDGYTLDGIKKYKRFFQIKLKCKKNSDNNNEKCDDNNSDNNEDNNCHDNDYKNHSHDTNNKIININLSI